MTEVRLLLVGDLILDEPDPDSFFEPSRELLCSADLVVGQVEVPHTDRGVPSSVDVPAPPAEPAHLAALTRAGLGVATLAGNHIFDSGPNGVEDTIAALHELGIATAGAGMNLSEARRPAVVERQGMTVGVLSYNCVGPRESRATSRKAGAAPLEVLTHYELDHAGPIHLGGADDVSRFDFAVLLGADERRLERAHTAPDRPADVSLDSSLAAGLLATRLRGVREVLGAG